jgi:hypothetical protein
VRYVRNQGRGCNTTSGFVCAPGRGVRGYVIIFTGGLVSGVAYVYQNVFFGFFA